MIPGECVGLEGTECIDCGDMLLPRVCSSAAGYYVGYWCDNCGPVSRETGYVNTYEDAALALENPVSYARK